jgi:hypothetical protein
MSEPLLFPILLQIGVAAAAPFAFMVTVILCSGLVADLLRKHGLSTANIRKVMTCSGSVATARDQNNWLMVFVLSGYTAQGLALFFISDVADFSTLIAFLTLGIGLSGFGIASGEFIGGTEDRGEWLKKRCISKVGESTARTSLATMTRS